MKKILVLAVLLICSAAFASEFDIQSSMTQSQFKSLVKEMGLIVTPTPNSPAEPLKTIGFDIALESTVTDISNGNDFWKNAWSDNDPSGYIMANRVHVQKGFPFGLDIGASITKGVNLDFTAVTGEVKYAILKGTVATPAISVKASYTKVFGLDDMSLQTASAGAYISKGILMFTPYAGVEGVYAFASDDSGNDLDNENVGSVRGIAGLQFSPFPLLVINAEAAAGTAMQYGLKLGLRF